MTQDKLHLTSDKVILFQDRLFKHFGARLIEKQDAIEMKVLSYFLDRITPIDNDEFMHKWSTTLGDRVYVPFEVGDTENTRYPLDQQISNLIHEIKHVVQYKRNGIVFALMYLLSDADRAMLEKEAKASTVEFNVKRFGASYIPDYKRYIEKLKNYRCSEEDCVAAANALQSDYMMFIQGIDVCDVVKTSIKILTDLGAWIE